MLVIDDIQKDDLERLYEWLMQTGPDTAVASLKTNDIILCDSTARRDANGLIRPVKGDRQLLVRVLDIGEPTRDRAYTSRPSFRLEEFERKDTMAPENTTAGLSGSRSFGLDKRLVIASRSVAPNFKILLFPRREGSPLPVTTWNADRTKLTIEINGQRDELTLLPGADGRTRVSLTSTSTPNAKPLTLD